MVLGLFPFRLVPQGSSIVLYGAGLLGRDFYLQLSDTGWCKVLAWVDQSFDNYEVNKPFDNIENAVSYDPDYYVLAISKIEIAVKARNFLVKHGASFDKIIWAGGTYCQDHRLFPVNKAMLLKKPRDYFELIDIYKGASSPFSGGHMGIFYESLSELGITGFRDSDYRSTVYKMDRFLTKDFEILDIGSNCGFFDLHIAGMVNSITGIELDSELTKVGEKAKSMLGIENVCFVTADFNEYHSDKTYDAVFSFAVHMYLCGNDDERRKYVDKIYGLVKHSGYVFFESQGYVDDDYWKLCSMFKEKGMEVCLHDGYKRDCFQNGWMDERDFMVLRKL